MGLVKVKSVTITGQDVQTGASGIGYAICGNKWDWSNFLQKWAGLVKLSMEAGRISQECPQEWMEIVQHFSEQIFLGVGQTFCRNGSDWSRVSLGPGAMGHIFCRIRRIGQTFSRKRHACSRVFPGVEGIRQLRFLEQPALVKLTGLVKRCTHHDHQQN